MGFGLVVGLTFFVPAAAQDMPLSQILIEGEGWQRISTGLNYPIQTLAADGQGNLFLADSGSQRIHRLSASGAVTVFAVEVPGIRGLCFGPAGLLYGCQPDERRILAWDTKGQRQVIAEGLAAHHLVVTRNGTIYCTVPAEGAVYLVGPQGRKRAVDQNIAAPAGLTLWPDQGTLVVADAGGKHLWTYRIEPDGTLAHKESYYPLRVRPGQTASGATGMTVDTAGRVYVASPAGVQVFDPTGRLSGVLLRPAETPLAAVAFAGPSQDVLYVASGSHVFARRTQTKGTFFPGR
jgi:enterochelin esterase family protein